MQRLWVENPQDLLLHLVQPRPPSQRDLRSPKSLGLRKEVWATVLVWAAITKYHSLGCLNNKHVFLTVLESRSPRLGCQLSGYWWGLSSWFTDGYLLAVSSCGIERTSVSFSSYKGTNPHGGLTFSISSKPSYLPKTSYPNTITLGIRASTRRLRGDTNIQSITTISFQKSSKKT